MAMITRKQFLAGTAGLVGAGVLSACGGGSSSGSSTASSSTGTYTLVKEGTLTGVSDMAYPPLESIDEGSTEPKGFEIDMMDALAKELGLTMAWLPPTKFDTIVPLIKQGGKADVGVSAFTINDERKEEIDFTDSYLDSNQGLATLASLQVEESDAAVKSLFDAADKKVACQSGTTGRDWIRENLPNAQCVPLDDAIEAMNGMQTGSYDAVVADLPVLIHLCKESYTDCKVALQIPTGEQYGIVVSKDNAKLTEALNKALATIQENGTMDDLKKKWFNGEV